jgi:hypothetical protein
MADGGKNEHAAARRQQEHLCHVIVGYAMLFKKLKQPVLGFHGKGSVVHAGQRFQANFLQSGGVYGE